MEKASATVRTPRGREDLRGQLAAMRKLAYRLRWLDRSIDPLDGLELLGSDYLHGTTGMYISPYLRPETRQVEAMARAADFLCKPGSTEPLLARTTLLGTQIRVAGYGGLRLGEQLALRAIDVFFERGLGLRQRILGHPAQTGWPRLPEVGQEPGPARGPAAPFAHGRRTAPESQAPARPARLGHPPTGHQRTAGRTRSTRTTTS